MEEERMKRSALIFAIVFVVSMLAFLVMMCGEQQAKTEKHPNVPTALQINFVGDKNKMVYHMPTCKYCPKDPAAIVPLDSPISAERGGFKPCKSCKPPTSGEPKNAAPPKTPKPPASPK
jgi:hypothetical protein